MSKGLKADNHMEFLAEMPRLWPAADAAWSNASTRSRPPSSIARSLIERLHELDFEIDGLVLKVNRFDQRERLGSTSKSPRWVIAYKFEKYEATTRLNGIRVQVGKTGAITPVADLEPVELAGTSSAGPACTMPTRSTARMSASATWWSSKRRARSFRTSSASKSI